MWGGRASAISQFLKARLARLYPLHLATLLIMLAMVLFFRWLAARGHYVSIYDLPGYHPVHEFLELHRQSVSRAGVALVSTAVVEWRVVVCQCRMVFVPDLSNLSAGSRGSARLGRPGADRVWLHGAGVADQAARRASTSPTIGGLLRGIADFAIGVGLAMSISGRAEARGDALVRALAFAGPNSRLRARCSSPFTTPAGRTRCGTTGCCRRCSPSSSRSHSIAELPRNCFNRRRCACSENGRSRSIWGRPPSCSCCAWPSSDFIQILRRSGRTTIHLLEPAALLILVHRVGRACSTMPVERPANAWLRRT